MTPNLSTARAGLHSEKRISQPMTASFFDQAIARAEAVIASSLCAIHQMRQGLAPKSLYDQSAAFQAFYGRRAQRASREMDDKLYDADKKAAVEETLYWLEGPCGERKLTHEEIIVEAISRYEAIRVRR